MSNNRTADGAKMRRKEFKRARRIEVRTSAAAARHAFVTGRSMRDTGDRDTASGMTPVLRPAQAFQHTEVKGVVTADKVEIITSRPKAPPRYVPQHHIPQPGEPVPEHLTPRQVAARKAAETRRRNAAAKSGSA